MQPLRLKNGLDLPLKGAPGLRRETLAAPAQVALTPARIAFIKPRLKVAVGDDRPFHHHAGLEVDDLPERVVARKGSARTLDALLPERLAADGAALGAVFNVAGLLHDAAGMRPERRLADVDPAQVMRSFAVNALGPLLVADPALTFLGWCGALLIFAANVTLALRRAKT